MGRHIQKVLAIALIFVFLTSSGAALGGEIIRADIVQSEGNQEEMVDE